MYGHSKINPQIVIHAIKHLYPIDLAITHNHITATETLNINLNNVSVIDESSKLDPIVLKYSVQY